MCEWAKCSPASEVQKGGGGGWRSVRSGRIQSLQRLPVLGLRSQRCWGKCYFRAVPSACLGILHISKDRVWSESTGGGQTGSWGESLRLCWEPSSQGQERKGNVPAPARGAHSLLNVAILGQVPRGRSLLPQSSCEEVAVGAVWRRVGSHCLRHTHWVSHPRPRASHLLPGLPLTSALPGGHSVPFLPLSCGFASGPLSCPCLEALETFRLAHSLGMSRGLRCISTRSSPKADHPVTCSLAWPRPVAVGSEQLALPQSGRGC